MSGILFNLAIGPALRRIQGDDTRHHALTFADDVALLADSPDDLQDYINRLVQDFSRINLRLNPGKSVALNITGEAPVGARDTTFLVGSELIKVLAEFDSHRFLGKPVGFSVLEDYTKFNDMASVGKKLTESALAPWQRFDALKTFFYSSRQFAMRTGQYGKTKWSEVDKALRPGLKATPSLPDNAANGYLYGSRSLGSAGIPIAAEEADINTVDSAFILLTSRDEEIARLVLQQLQDAARHQFRTEQTDEILGLYRSGKKPEDPTIPHSGRTANT